MPNGTKLFALLLPFIMIYACAARKPQPDPLAPLKEDISLLQKQHLELQKQFTDTQIKLEESSAMVQNVTNRLTRLESRSSRPKADRSVEEKKKRKTTRRKKKTRR